MNKTAKRIVGTTITLTMLVGIGYTLNNPVL